MKVFNRKYMKDCRKDLRNNSTQAESCLWQYLKKSQFENKKFRRQHGIGKYVVDFYCPEEKLVLELDGEIHLQAEQIKHDEIRKNYIELLGIKILRFENEDVLNNPDKVLQKIKEYFNRNNKNDIE